MPERLAADDPHSAEPSLRTVNFPRFRRCYERALVKMLRPSRPHRCPLPRPRRAVWEAMLLTLETTYQPATDLGYLLHKNPARVQQFELSAGRATVFYPQVTPEACT